MPEISLTDPASRDMVQPGDVYRYDGPALIGPGGVWRSLLPDCPHPAWAYLPDFHDGSDPEPWALLTNPGNTWDLWWGWEDLPPVVTLVLRDGQPAAPVTTEGAETDG